MLPVAYEPRTDAEKITLAAVEVVKSMVANRRPVSDILDALKTGLNAANHTPSSDAPEPVRSNYAAFQSTGSAHAKNAIGRDYPVKEATVEDMSRQLLGTVLSYLSGQITNPQSLMEAVNNVFSTGTLVLPTLANSQSLSQKRDMAIRSALRAGPGSAFGPTPVQEQAQKQENVIRQERSRSMGFEYGYNR